MPVGSKELNVYRVWSKVSGEYLGIFLSYISPNWMAIILADGSISEIKSEDVRFEYPRGLGNHKWSPNGSNSPNG